MTYVTETTDWQKIELTGPMLGFLTSIWPYFCVWQRRNIYAAWMALFQIPQVNRRHTAALYVLHQNSM